MTQLNNDFTSCIMSLWKLWHLWPRETQRDQLSQSVSPPGHVTWFFMQGHLQHPVSPVGFVKASEVGGKQRGELEGQTPVWP